jgi:hypothetical protein
VSSRSAISWGTHNILAILNLYREPERLGRYIAYTNLSRRTNYGFAVFQYQKDLLLFSSPQNDDLESQIHRGGAIFFSRAVNRFRRIEYGIQAAVVDQRIYRYDYVNGVRTKLGDDVGLSLRRAEPGHHPRQHALRLDRPHQRRSVPSLGGARHRRTRLHDEPCSTSAGITTSRGGSRSRDGSSAAPASARIPSSSGSAAPSPIAARDYGDLIGTRSGILNLEMRFPLIRVQLRVGFPLTLSLGGVNGVVFLDAASAWDSGHRSEVLLDRGRLPYGGLRAAFGFGARINLGYFILRYDYGREHRFKRGLDEPRHFVTFGPEF